MKMIINNACAMCDSNTHTHTQGLFMGRRSCDLTLSSDLKRGGQKKYEKN